MKASSSRTKLPKLKKSQSGTLLAPLLEPFKEFEHAQTTSNNGILVGKELAQGCDGNVFAAWNVVKLKPVALKMIKVNGAIVRKHILSELATAFGPAKDARGQHLIPIHGWFPGAAGVEREIIFVMDLGEFALNDIIYIVRSARAVFDKRIQVINYYILLEN